MDRSIDLSALLMANFCAGSIAGERTAKEQGNEVDRRQGDHDPEHCALPWLE